MFFPPPHFERKVDRLEREARAKRICATCPVDQDCLAYSLTIKEPHGIWGGLNEAEGAPLRPMVEVEGKEAWARWVLMTMEGDAGARRGRIRTGDGPVLFLVL